MIGLKRGTVKLCDHEKEWEVEAQNTILRLKMIYAVVYFLAMDKTYGIIQMGVVLAIPFLKLYNGKRGKNPSINKWMKWLFYVYYPLHLFVIGIIQNH